MVSGFASRDSRSEELIGHTVATLVGQCVFRIALGYCGTVDVVDHDELCHDSIMSVLAGKLATRRTKLRAGSRQIDAQPARTGQAGADALLQDWLRPASHQKGFLSICLWRRSAVHRRRSFSIWMLPTTRCTGIRKALLPRLLRRLLLTLRIDGYDKSSKMTTPLDSRRLSMRKKSISASLCFDSLPTKARNSN